MSASEHTRSGAARLPPPSAPRWAHLDALRGFALLLVLGRHGGLSPSDWAAPHPLRPLLEAWHRIGWVGVDVFFVLSGFLIGLALLAESDRTGTLRPGRFILRRGLRLWPAYYAMLGLWVLLGGVSAEAGTGQGDRLAAVWPALVHLQNYLPINHAVGGQDLIHLWSLAVEEHFYLALPLLLLLAAKLPARYRGTGPALLTVAAVCAVCLLLRVITHELDGAFTLLRNYTPTHLRIDAPAVGVGLALLVRRRPEAWLRRGDRWWLLVPVGLTLLLTPLLRPLHTTDGHTWGFVPLYAGALCLVLAAWARSVRAAEPPGRLWRAAAWVGVISYGAYLFHVPFAASLLEAVGLGEPQGPHARVARFAAFVAAALIFGALSHALIEQPVLRLRDRWMPRRPRVA